jgi:nucleoside-diphosphate-sugar epimerase
VPARRLLVTGLSGLIGGALRAHLGGKYPLRALNRRPVAGVECVQADLGDLAAIQPAFEDVDTVVHLGAAAGDRHTPEDLLRSNVIGTYHVYEAARRAKVRRVIFASSGATIAGWEREPPLSHIVDARYAELGSWTPLTHEAPLRPGGMYGATKVWGEALARVYADTHGLSMICVRIGRVLESDRPTSAREKAVWCSQRDVVRMLEACIEAPPSVRFDVFYAVSDNRWNYRDLGHARAVLGWAPLDRAEDRAS